MKSFALTEFGDCLEHVPAQVQKNARKNFQLWQKNFSLKSLAIRKIKSDPWSVRAGPGFRALATFDGGRNLWFWIGPLDEYERIIRDF